MKKRKQYVIKEDGNFNKPLLAHMRAVAFTPVVIAPDKRDDASVLAAAAAKRARKQKARVQHEQDAGDTN